jgi:hypothetical protein
MINHHTSMIQLMSACVANNIKVDYFLGTHDSLIPRMRNKIVKEFLEKDYDYLFFIDSDVSFSPDDFFHMIYLAETSDMELLAGAYPKKNIFWQNIDYAIKNNLIENFEDYKKYGCLFNVTLKKEEKFNFEKPVEVNEISTGFMLISKNVFIDFINNYPDQIGLDYDNNILYSFFETKLDYETKQYLSEDYLFCKMLKKIGYKIWLIPYIKLDHLGTMLFSGEFKNYIKLLEK